MCRRDSIKSYNLLGEKSDELTENFKKSRDVNTKFEQKMTPWTCLLYTSLTGISTVSITPYMEHIFAEDVYKRQAYAYSDGGNEEPPVVEETPAPEPAPTITPGEGFSEDGNLVTRDLLYDCLLYTSLCKRTKRFIQNQNKDGFQPHQTPACLLRQRGRSGDCLLYTSRCV